MNKGIIHMIYEAMKKAGLSLRKQNGSPVEYYVYFRKPEKCDQCSGSKEKQGQDKNKRSNATQIYSRGMKELRRVYDLIDNTQIEEVIITAPRFTCKNCKRNIFVPEEKSAYDKILPARSKLTEDAKTFLIRKQLQNPDASYSLIANESLLGKPLIAALFESFIADVRKCLTNIMQCDRLAIIPFNWQDEQQYCLFTIAQATNEIGVLDILSADLVRDMLIWFARHNIEPNSIVCNVHDPLLADIASVYDGEIFYLQSSFDGYRQYFKDQLGTKFAKLLRNITAESDSTESKIRRACEGLDETVYSYPEGFSDDIRDYFLCIERAVDIGHQEYISKTIEDIKSMRSRGIEYDSIALRYIFSNPLAKAALLKTDMAKYIIEPKTTKS